jgi:elongation factor P hydroxylase
VNNIEEFKKDVQNEAMEFTRTGLPKRAQRFADALVNKTGRKDYMQETYYVERPGV